jgi:hypothetical protein
MQTDREYLDRLENEVEQMKGKHRRLGEAIQIKQRKLDRQQYGPNNKPLASANDKHSPKNI